MLGEIYSIIADKGYGFIRGEDGLSRFFHCRQLVEGVSFDRLRIGDKVEFKSVEDGHRDNKLRAVTVRVVS